MNFKIYSFISFTLNSLDFGNYIKLNPLIKAQNRRKKLLEMTAGIIASAQQNESRLSIFYPYK